MGIIFTETEIKQLQKNPEALDALINEHDCWATMADAVGDYEQCVKFHDERAKEIKAVRDKILAEM